MTASSGSKPGSISVSRRTVTTSSAAPTRRTRASDTWATTERAAETHPPTPLAGAPPFPAERIGGIVSREGERREQPEADADQDRDDEA